MPRKAGTPNRSRRIYSEPLGKRWRYDARIVRNADATSDLHILRIYGAEIKGNVAELDEAIKAECVKLGATVHLDDHLASAIMFSRMAVVQP